MNKVQKKKLFIYPNARKHDHDVNNTGLANNLYNTVPMSEKGIEDYFVITGPDEAEYFYMGQFSQDVRDTANLFPKDFKYFKGNEAKHICDIDGEGGFEYSYRPAIPEWLHGSIITANGITKNYSNIKYLFPSHDRIG